MDVKAITSNENQFYPTPREVALRMLSGIDWKDIKTVLEPSAGKGDLIEAFGEYAFKKMYSYTDNHLEVDCVEIDPYLRSVLKYQFSDERADLVYEMLPKNQYGHRYESDYSPLYKTLKYTDMHIVHDNFLTFKPYKQYDLIVMNPPFKDGEKHLLHAIDMQKNGGQIVCLLNAETLRNPFSNVRKELQKRLDRYGAGIEYIMDAFKDAERGTDVEIVIVKVNIPKEELKSSMFDRLKKAAEEENFIYDCTDLIAGDYIEAAVRRFNIECRAGIELIREWQALCPHMTKSFGEDSFDKMPMLDLKLGDHKVNVNGYLRALRLKYWGGLFTNEKFMRNLTTKLREQYLATVEKMRDYDFSIFNIKTVMLEMDSQIMTGIQDEILAMFDTLTEEHSYYPECQKTIHYYNGWKTNIGHKIGKKSIIPAHLESYSWNKVAFDLYKATGVLSDIEKIFDYLSGNMKRDIMKTDISCALQCAYNRGQTKNINCTYFSIDIYKKGTVHIKYIYPELVDRFNIYAAKNRNWLPPGYGTARYSGMTDEEQTVINEFHRAENEKEIDSNKSAQRYAEILADSQFYMADPVNNTALLELKI